MRKKRAWRKMKWERWQVKWGSKQVKWESNQVKWGGRMVKWESRLVKWGSNDERLVWTEVMRTAESPRESDPLRRDPRSTWKKRKRSCTLGLAWLVWLARLVGLIGPTGTCTRQKGRRST